MDAETTVSLASNLRIQSQTRDILSFQTQEPITPNQWFSARYSEQFHQFGSPFLELTQPLDQFRSQTVPISINQDFFAVVLGGRKDLKHHTVYFEPELAWYFKDSDQIYKPTSAEKLANLYRALMIKCSQDMPPHVHVLNLFQEFRSDKVAKL